MNALPVIDRWSRTFPLLLEPRSALRILQDACEGSGWRVTDILDAEVIAEREGKRRTLRYRVRAGRLGERPRTQTWFAKQYRGSKGERIGRVLSFLHEKKDREASVTEPVGYSPRSRILVTRVLEGWTLPAILSGSDGERADAVLEPVGRAVSWIHSIAPSPSLALTPHGPSEEIRVLERAQERANDSTLSAELIRRFVRARAAIQMDLSRGNGSCSGHGTERAPDRSVMLHRDLHPGQVVLLAGATGFMDWDDAALGEPELDVGNLEAHLILHDLQERGRVIGALRRIEALRAGYLVRGRLDPERLATYRRASLLRLASLERLAGRRISVLPWPLLASALLDEIDSTDA